MNYLLLITELEWVHNKDAFIVALVLAISGLAWFILYLIKSHKKELEVKDALIMEFTRESIAAIVASNMKSTTHSGEHKDIRDDVKEVYDNTNKILIQQS